MSTLQRLLVVQHLDVEHPGIFRDFLRADGIAWDTVEIDLGEVIPPLEDYAGLWVMGGPMDVWEESVHPWLVAEKAAIRRAVEDLDMPFLGICLGHQLLAAALGGEVGPGSAEVGVMPVEMNQHGRASPYFAELPATFDCLQWHSAQVKRMPAAALCLAHSEACAVQAMQIGRHALSAQFHVEVTHDTVAEWGAVPAYAAALADAMGDGALEQLARTVNGELPAFNQQARIVYDNWMRVSGVRERIAAIEV